MTFSIRSNNPLALSSIDREDFDLRVSNREDGVRDYLNNLNKAEGKLYITPKGPFSVLRQVEDLFQMYRKTIIRRFRSKRAGLAQWYVIEGDTPLQPEEDCNYCDVVDNTLFAIDCWMTRINHTHDTPLQDCDTIEYLFKGVAFTVTYRDLINNQYPHNTGGNK